MTPHDARAVLATIDVVEANSARMAAAAGGGITGAELVAPLVEMRESAREARAVIEATIETGTPSTDRELLPQSAMSLQAIESGITVILYAWHGEDRGYDVGDWVKLTASAAAKLIMLRPRWLRLL